MKDNKWEFREFMGQMAWTYRFGDDSWKDRYSDPTVNFRCDSNGWVDDKTDPPVLGRYLVSNDYGVTTEGFNPDLKFDNDSPSSDGDGWITSWNPIRKWKPIVRPEKKGNTRSKIQSIAEEVDGLREETIDTMRICDPYEQAYLINNSRQHALSVVLKIIQKYQETPE